jgi:hypothetical protein
MLMTAAGVCLPQGDRDIKNREAERRKNTTPSTTLFVVNFDVVRTRERDLQDLYERYGRLRRVQVCLPSIFRGRNASHIALSAKGLFIWHMQCLILEAARCQVLCVSHRLLPACPNAADH